MRASIVSLVLVLGLFAGAAPARAQSLNEQAVRRMNLDAQALWAQDGLPMIRSIALEELQKLVGKPQRINDKTTATITRVHSLTLDCPGAPGLTRLDQSRIEIAAPLQGTWRFAASAGLHVKGRFLGIGIDRTYTINIEVKDLRAEAKMDVDSSDPASPRLAKAYPVAVNFNLKVTTSSWVMNFLLWLTRGTVNGVADGVAIVGSRYLAQRLNLQYAGTPEVTGGVGGPGLAPVRPADLEGAAVKAEREIQRLKLPFGTIVEGRFHTDYRGTWEDSFRDPSFDPGPLDLDAVGAAGDSALMTGYYLAGLCFRYGATRSPEALADARAVLRATRTLLTMKGRPGDLNRTIMPNRPGLQLGGDWYVQSFQGVDYAMCDYISRDAYTGIFVGLSVAYDMLDVQSDRDEAREQFEMAIDYLLANGWTHRKRDGTFGERWHGAIEHQYAWVMAAYHMSPGKYWATLEQYKGYADILWTAIWTGVLDTYYSYYKFSLANHALYTGLRNEFDPVRWQRAYQGVAIMRRHIGHHQNAQFNNCYLAIDPSSRSALGAENRILLTRRLRSPRRFLIYDLRQDPTIEKVKYRVPFDTNLLFPGQGVPQEFDIAKYPIPVERRLSSGYLWSRNPYALGQDYIGGEEPRHEGEGVDLVLPYWMARYYRAIPAPTPRPAPVSATGSARGPSAAPSAVR